MLRTAPLLTTLCLLPLLACATAQRAEDAPVTSRTDRPIPPTPRPGDIEVDPIDLAAAEDWVFVDGRTGKAMTYDDVLARARTADFVLAGEQHDQAAHHRLQQRLAESLAADGGLAIGLEMVPWHLQDPLDRYTRGDIDVDAMFAALDWENTWGHDADLYRGIFERGRAGSARFVALNAPRDLVRAVARKGVDGLDDEERSQLPELDLSDEVHRGSIEQFFRQHHPPTGSSGDSFDRFYAAQVLWDESMADRSVRAFEGDARRVLVLAGVGHVAGYRGIPQRILRRVPDARVLTVVPLPIDEDESPEEAVRDAVARGDGDILAIKKPREVVHL